MNLGRPTDRKPPFKFSSLTRVGFSDTDAQGIVYYGRYLPYFDDARVEYHRHLELLAFDHGPSEFVMRASNVLYEAPARFDDLLEVFVRVDRIGRTSVTYDPSTNRATLNPKADLRSGATYFATVTTNAKDLAGNQLDQVPNTAGYQPKVWTFQVRR